MLYLLTFNEAGEVLTWARLRDGGHAEVAGNLENKPVGYAYHRVVSRDEVVRHFVLDEDE